MLGSFKKVSVIGAAILVADVNCWKERMKMEGEEIQIIVEAEIKE